MVAIQGQSWMLADLENNLEVLVQARYHITTDNGKNAVSKPSQFLMTLRYCLPERKGTNWLW